MELPQGYEAARRRTRGLLPGIRGHLSDKEIDFLFLLGAVPAASGEVLEIGSFEGRSTVVLAEATKLAGDERLVAVDPLDSPASTDPRIGERPSVEPDFRRNLESAGVKSHVEFHKTRSEELALHWDHPLRLLWIDGDHTLAGTRRDFAAFEPHLIDRGFVALHDVLHRHGGPLRVFMEEVLLSERFGACGLCGSIGWAQRVHEPDAAVRHRAGKLKLWKRLSRLLPHTALGLRESRWNRRVWKWKRNFVPHGPMDPIRWVARLDVADNTEESN